jgi:hypothetical protein
MCPLATSSTDGDGVAGYTSHNGAEVLCAFQG